MSVSRGLRNDFDILARRKSQKGFAANADIRSHCCEDMFLSERINEALAAVQPACCCGTLGPESVGQQADELPDCQHVYCSLPEVFHVVHLYVAFLRVQWVYS